MSNAMRVHHGTYGRIAVLEMSRSLVVHAHAQTHVLFRIGGVDSQFTVRDQPVPLTAASAVLINSWEPHAYHHPDTGVRTLVLALYLDPAWLCATATVPLQGARFPATSQPVDGELAARISALAGRLMVAGWTGGDIDDAVFDVVRRLRSEDAGRAAGEAVDRRISRCVTYMREHLDEHEELALVGSRFGLSRPHLFYLFQRTFSVTPHVYWNTLRMEYALDALRSRRLAIGTIARDTGFSSQSNFTRFFQGIQGVGPRDYQSAALKA